MLGGTVDRTSRQAKEGRHRAEDDEGLAFLHGVLVQVKEGEFGGCCRVLGSGHVGQKDVVGTLAVSHAVQVRSESAQDRSLRS